MILSDSTSINHVRNSIYPSSETEAFELAKQYVANGWAVTPCHPKSKRPILPQWQTRGMADEELEQYFNSNNPCNTAIVLGDHSHGLVDVDIDNTDCVAFADAFLPETQCVFGRESRRRSHRIYTVASAGQREAFQHGQMFLELRGNKHYTVFPGSIHPTGEYIEFENDDLGVPAETTWDELKRAACKIAIATLLFTHWKSGTRHELALGASGFLLGLEFSQNDVETLIREICQQACDNDLSDRMTCIRTTYENRAQGKAISGRVYLVSLIGEDAVKSIEKWCGSHGTSRRNASGPSHTQIDIITDAGVADAFADSHKDQLIFCPETDRWFEKQNQVFRPTTLVAVQGKAKEFNQQTVAGLAQSVFGGPNLSRSLLSKVKINSSIELSRYQFSVPFGLFDQAKHLVGCADGQIFDLDQRRYVSSDGCIVTKTLGYSLLPEADCPRWKTFLDEIFAGDAEVISFIQRAVGYSLSGSTEEQCFFILTGKGCNGKSTFLNTLQTIFGDYAATTPSQTLMVNRYGTEQTNDLAKLTGVRLAIASETEKGQRLAEAKIKRLTGGDKIACREMYRDFFNFIPECKVWLATNDLPEFSGADDFIARRIRLIHFPVTFDESMRDYHLQEKLLSEAPGIIDWAIQGYLDWKKTRLSPPEQILVATRNYRLENDNVGQFIDACCILSPTFKEMTKDLYNAYKPWCENSGLNAVSISSFGKELGRRFVSIKRRTGNGWKGLQLHPDLKPSQPF